MAIPIPSTRRVISGTLDQSTGYALEHGVDTYLVNVIWIHKKIGLDLLKWAVTSMGDLKLRFPMFNTIRCMGRGIPVMASGDH
jgi:hypothetical protein